MGIRGKRILVLAGQRESVDLVARLEGGPRMTVAIDPFLGEVARGDFGAGVEIRAPLRSAAAMMTALKWDRTQAVIDASDPFDEAASGYAAAACRALGTPLIQLRRPGFTRSAPGIEFRSFETVEAAARVMSPFARAFVQLPLDRLPVFRSRPLAWYFIRVHRPPAGRFPFRRGDFAVGAPPFALAHERILFADRRVDHLVIGDVGGALATPTLQAAQERGAAILAIAPPDLPAPTANGARVDDVDTALERLHAIFA